jgi:putative tricarboxylic transport membrane protein
MIKKCKLKGNSSMTPFYRLMMSGVIATAVVLAITHADVQAADKPAIEVITHAGAGGGTDVNSRMMMLRGRRTLKQDMVVVNKRGGGGAAAMNYFMSRPADGNTIMTFTVGHAITMGKGKTKLKVQDMAPLARGTNDPQILMVNCKTSPYKTPEEFVAGMKNGDKLKFGGTQIGTIDHITVFLWAKRLGQPMPNYIPFKGGGELATQLVAGSVDVGTLNLSEAAAPVEAGDICPLVILANAGMAPIPKAKTAKALGIDLVLSTTRGFVTHAGVSAERRAELEKGMAKAMKHSMYQAYLANSGLDETSPQPSGPWGEQIEAMVGEFGPALKEMGLVK